MQRFPRPSVCWLARTTLAHGTSKAAPLHLPVRAPLPPAPMLPHAHLLQRRHQHVVCRLDGRQLLLAVRQSRLEAGHGLGAQLELAHDQRALFAAAAQACFILGSLHTNCYDMHSLHMTMQLGRLILDWVRWAQGLQLP